MLCAVQILRGSQDKAGVQSEDVFDTLYYPIEMQYNNFMDFSTNATFLKERNNRSY